MTTQRACCSLFHSRSYCFALVQLHLQTRVPPAMPRAAKQVRAFLCLPPAEGHVHLIYVAATSYKTARCSRAERATPRLQTHTSSILQFPGFPERRSSELPRLLYPPQETAVPQVVLQSEPTGLGLEPAAASSKFEFEGFGLGPASWL